MKEIPWSVCSGTLKHESKVVVMNPSKARRRAVQLDLFSLVDESGNLVLGEAEVPALANSGSHDARAGTMPGPMCGDRSVETGWPWTRSV